MTIKERLQEATKDAMRAKDKARLDALRLINAAIKQIEVDERKVLTDAEAIAVLTKLIKQRRDSAQQFTAAGRQELADKENFEIDLIQSFLPQPLSPDEIEQAVNEAFAATGAATMQDMGKVMGLLKDKLQGRADMAEVSKLIRAKLS